MSFNRKYEHLFFDLDNTLWDFDTNAKITMEQTVAELKIDSQIKNFEEFYSVYEGINSALWRAYQRQEIRKPELIRKRFEDTLNHFNIKGIDPVMMNDLYLDIMPLQKTLIPGTIDILDYLKSNKFKLHIISNGFKKVQTQKLKSSGLSGYFDKVFVSEEIEAPKPNIKIFRHALSNCNAHKKKSLMIGDSFETDIIGASRFGIDQVYFENPLKTETTFKKNGDDTEIFKNICNKPTDTPTYTINNLKCIKEILLA